MARSRTPLSVSAGGASSSFRACRSPSAGVLPSLPFAVGRRAALIRFWRQRHLLREPFPFTGTDALRADTPWALALWIPAFLEALAKEAENGLQLLMTLERAWFSARRATAARRRTSRAAAAVDVLATAPLVLATSLGQALGMAIKNAAQLLDEFCDDGVAVGVTHRSKRRLSASPLSLPYAMRWRRHAGRKTGGDEDDRRFIQPRKRLLSLSSAYRRSRRSSGGHSIIQASALPLVNEAMSNIQRTLADGACGVNAIRAGQAGDGDPERNSRGGQLERGE
jgi:hypothetical protein